MATITIAPEHVDELRAAALSLYSVKAESLHVATNGYLGDQGSLAPLVHHRAESREVEALLDQLDWRFEPQSTPVILRGPANLLAELLQSALIGRLESLVDALTPAEEEASLGLEAVARELDEANALVGLLEEVRAQEQR